MIDFGFEIQADRQIDLDKADKRLSELIRNGEPSFNICISCGSCAATCSAGNYSSLSFRKVIHFIKRGETEQVKSEIKSCMLCGKCQIVCPRGVNTRNIIRIILNHMEATQ